MVAEDPDAVLLLRCPAHLVRPAAILLVLLAHAQVHIAEQHVATAAAVGIRVGQALVKDVGKVYAVAESSACRLRMEGVEHEALLQNTRKEVGLKTIIKILEKHS